MKKPESPVALVTGAGKRLGRHIALSLAREGFDLILHFHESSKGAVEVRNEIQHLGRSAVIAEADLRITKEIRALIKMSMTAFGRIDVLVNNAAIFVDSSLSQTSERVWDDVLGINLKGMFFTCQYVAPIMLKQSSGRIINIASLGGIQAWPRHLPYSISKAGVVMLTKVLAKELAPCIMVNAIAPGVIDLGGEEDPTQVHIPRKRIPLKRYGRPEDVTTLVTYLSTVANYITGQIVTVDGGRSI